MSIYYDVLILYYIKKDIINIINSFMKRLIRGIMKDDRLEKNKLAFYSQLENMFAGKDLKNFKGKSGFSNLLSIKSKYFEHKNCVWLNVKLE